MTDDEKKAAARQKAIDDANAAALKKKADAEAERIMNSDIDANLDNEEVKVKTRPRPARDEKAEAAYDKLRAVTLDFPPSTPDEHIVFGRASFRVNLGDLRALFSAARN